MNELVERIRAFMADIRAKANASLTKVGPLDQIEAGQEILSAIRALKWTADEAEELGQRVESIQSDLERHVTEQIEAKVAAGEYVPKEDFDAKIAAAKDEAKTEAVKEKDGEIAALKRMEGNRRLVTQELPAAVAAAVSDEVLQLEDCKPAVAELKRRTDELAKVGLKAADTDEKRRSTLVRKVFCAAPDDDGAKVFDAELSDLVALGLKPAESAPADPSKPSKPSSVRASAPGGGAPPVTNPPESPQSSARPAFAF